MTKAEEFFRAVYSFVRWGDAPLDEHDKRQTICMECPQLSVKRAGIFCKSCPCPEWALSDLRSKWRMRDLQCPEKKW